MQVKLTACEQLLAEQIATNRHHYDHATGVEDRLAASRDPIVNAIKAYECELAVCKFLNVYPDLQWELPEKHDLMYVGRKVDVKWIPDSHMNIRSDRPLVAGLYIGVGINGNAYYIHGFMSKEKVTTYPIKEGIHDKAPPYRSIHVMDLSQNWHLIA